MCLLRRRRPDLAVVLPDRPDALVLADPDQLQRAFGNLLENAATATPLGDGVTVTRAVWDGALSVRVTDTGPGVPEPFRERVFDRFVRVAAARGGEGPGWDCPSPGPSSGRSAATCSATPSRPERASRCCCRYWRPRKIGNSGFGN
nr:HAMP domain-containing sensor histidine kinase [Nakamurella panacisegetis]